MFQVHVVELFVAQSETYTQDRRLTLLVAHIFPLLVGLKPLQLRRKLVIREEPRRAGDPAVLVAKADRIRELLGWSPKLDDLDTIVRSSLDWEARLQRNPW